MNKQKFSEKSAKYDHNNIDKNLVMLWKPQSFEAEQFRMLKTKIYFSDTVKPPRSIMITSCFPNEGKSFVSINLAISIAMSLDKHVLLMDCDLRRPSIHRMLGFGNVPGLSEFLKDNAPFSSLYLKTVVNKLLLLPAGKPPKNPGELLSSEKMKMLLQVIKTRFDNLYLIIDSPPPRIIADTKLIAQQSDGVILVVKYGKTPREQVSKLAKLIGKDKIIAVVINQFDSVFVRQKEKYYSNYYQP